VKAITRTTDDALRWAGFVVVSRRLFTEREVRLYERRPAASPAGNPMRPSSPLAALDEPGLVRLR